MEEEKKEKPEEGQVEQRPVEMASTQPESKPEAPILKPTPQPTTTVTGEDKKKVASKKEEPSNCAACNKSIEKKRWYYRDGKYYCTKRCWRTVSKSKDKTGEVKK